MGGNSLKKENILSSLRKQNDTFWFVILLLCKAGKKALSLKWTLGRLSSRALVVEKTPQRPLSARGCIKLGPEKRTPSKDYLKIRKKAQKHQKLKIWFDQEVRWSMNETPPPSSENMRRIVFDRLPLLPDQKYDMNVLLFHRGLSEKYNLPSHKWDFIWCLIQYSNSAIVNCKSTPFTMIR